MVVKLKATHILKKEFEWDNKKSFKKGSLVYIPKGNHKFNNNIFFLTKTGRIKKEKNYALHLYSKDFFKPRKKWFEKISPETSLENI